jgi:hypothetical protein
MTQSGIEPATFRLVVQCLNCATAWPFMSIADVKRPFSRLHAHRTKNVNITSKISFMPLSRFLALTVPTVTELAIADVIRCRSSVPKFTQIGQEVCKTVGRTSHTQSTAVNTQTFTKLTKARQLSVKKKLPYRIYEISTNCLGHKETKYGYSLHIRLFCFVNNTQLYFLRHRKHTASLLQRPTNWCCLKKQSMLIARTT